MQFRIRDVYIPAPQDLLMTLHSDGLLEGKVIDLSDDGTQLEVFAVVEVEGIEQAVIIPTERILGVCE